MKKLLCSLLAIRGASLFALTVSPTAVQHQLDTAALVADIRIESREGQAANGVFRRTFSNAEVLDIVEDRASSALRAGDRIRLETPGGEAAGTGMFVSGLPRPYVGRRYRAFLNRDADGVYHIAGFERGFRDLSAGRAFTRNRTDGSNGTGTGAFLYWSPTNLPIPYFLYGKSFVGHPDFADAVDDSLQAWAAPDEVILSFLAMGCNATDHNANDGLNNIVLVTDKWLFDEDAIAITRNFYVADTSNRAGTILDSDILLNGVNHRFSTDRTAGTHDVQNIVTHEAGHFIGLGHESAGGDTDATMYAQAGTGEFNKRTLKASDLAGLRAAYAGVVPKRARTRTRELCGLAANGNLGCARVHGAGPTKIAWPWFALWTTLTVCAGRLLRRFAPRNDRA